MSENEELLTFFKALADSNRLKIIGLLARQSYTVEQLAALLGVSPSTTSHHLSKLAEAGLVSASAQSYYNYYRLENGQIEAMARRLSASDTFPAVAAGIDSGTASATAAAAQAYDQKVIHAYLLPNGQLKTIPSQRKKLLVVMHHIVQSFEPGRRYAEPEVNEILARFHEDTASLRRELISAGLMKRESNGQAYWRVETDASTAA